MSRTSIRRIRSTTIAAFSVAVGSLACGAASALAVTGPSIIDVSAPHVWPTDARLEAQINPGGLETTYQFKLESGCGIEAPDRGHGTCLVIVESEIPAATIPPSEEVENVSIELNSVGVVLSPLTEYRYSLEATNSAGPAVMSAHQTFKTPSWVSIDGEWASGVTEHDATLNADINPNGKETIYFFKIFPDASYDYTHADCPFAGCTVITVGPPLPPGLVEPGFEWIAAAYGDQAVGLDLASIGAYLQPGTTYHYEVVATNWWQAPGRPLATISPDNTFTTAGIGPNAPRPGDPVAPPSSSPLTRASSVTHPKKRRKHLHRHRHKAPQANH